MKTIGGWVVLVLLAAAASAALFSGQQTGARELRAAFSEQGERRVKVIAHRGGSACAPENTLAALEQAVLAGADLAEIDLQLTGDGEVIALHDHTLTRTTGGEQAAADLDLRTIRELDAGDWFSPEFEGERIPTLAELLDTAKGRIGLMLELKYTPFAQILLEKVVEQIKARGMEDTCAVASADLELLRRSKELAPSVQTVYIGEKTDTKLWGQPYVDGYSICLSGLTAQDVERSHREGRELYAWTVNEVGEIQAALAFGVDGLVSDDPALVRALLRESPALSDFPACMDGG